MPCRRCTKAQYSGLQENITLPKDNTKNKPKVNSTTTAPRENKKKKN
jgi:hypothetical protein